MASIESTHVLIVDDSLTDAELTIHALQVNGRAPKVTWLSCAEEAISYLFRIDQYRTLSCGTPQLVLLDVDMPGIGGIEVLSRIKGDPRTRRVPIVMLSSNSSQALVRHCYELGANGYIVKPVAAIEYFQKIGAIANYWLILSETVVETPLCTPETVLPAADIGELSPATAHAAAPHQSGNTGGRRFAMRVLNRTDL